MSDDVTKHTAPDVEAKASSAERRGFANYREYLRHEDAYRSLDDQRNILMAILFDGDAVEFSRKLSPGAFTKRHYYDFSSEKGYLEILAEIAFGYWEQHGEPPGERIYDLIATMPERIDHIVKRMDGNHRRLKAVDTEAQSLRKRYSQRPDWDDEADERLLDNERDDVWQCMRVSIENYLTPYVRSSRTPTKQRHLTRTQERGVRNQRVVEMLKEGRSRREIMDETGYSAGRIAQIAGLARTSAQ